MSSDDPFASMNDGNGEIDGIDGDSGEFEIDLSAVDEDLGAEGIAEVQLVSLTKDVSKAGNSMWIWEFMILKYVEPEGVTPPGEVFKVFTALSRKALWKLDETVAALGVKKDKDGKIRFTAAELIGTVCLASMKITEYNGRKNLNIEALQALTEGPRKESVNMPGGSDDIPF